MLDILDKTIEEYRGKLSGLVNMIYFGNADTQNFPDTHFPMISVYLDSSAVTPYDTCHYQANITLQTQISVSVGNKFKSGLEMDGFRTLLQIVGGKGKDGNFSKNSVLGVLTQKNFYQDCHAYITNITFTDFIQ
jgi:hypothetical protein